MKNFIKNCLATTGLTMLLLALTAVIYGGRFIFVSSVFQSGLVNVLIHSGFFLLKRLESNYFLVEISVEIVWFLTVVLVSGYFFDWYQYTPVPVLVVMSISIYIISSLIDIIRIRNDIREINERLNQRRS